MLEKAFKDFSQLHKTDQKPQWGVAHCLVMLVSDGRSSDASQKTTGVHSCYFFSYVQNKL